MKILNIILLVVAILAALATAWPAFGQEPLPAAPSVTPAAAATPVEAASAASAAGAVTPEPVDKKADKVVPDEVTDAINTFFQTIGHGEVDRAYDVLTKNSKIGENVADVTLLKDKSREAIKLYGAVRGNEVTEVKVVGKHLARITTISLGADMPLRWRFYYYDSAAGWKLIDLRVDDRLVDLFGENPVEAPAPASSSAP
ncbi:MAG: hypothetical protein QM796_03925 [Chthoniobacteraceae bacterium]